MDDAKRRGRGKGVSPAMVYFSFRVSKDVLEYFEQYPNRSEKIREVLANYVNQIKGQNDEKIIEEITAVK